MREAGVAGRWTPGTVYGPGIRDPGREQRVNMLWGPDGFIIEVTPTNGRASMKRLLAAHARRPVLVQVVNDREMARLPLSDLLDLLAIYTQWLAQEGRLGDDE